MAAFRWLALILLLAVSGEYARAGQYDLSIPEAEKTPWELGGKLELRYAQHRLNDQSARYRLSYYNRDPGAYTEEWRPQLELKGGYRLGAAQFHFVTHHEYSETVNGGEWVNKVYEGYVSLKPATGLTLEAGKKSYLWGKGYAWNPAGFVNRPKDPDDPELNLEGYTALGLEYIKSLGGGALNNLALTFLILPVLGDWENTELGTTGNLNYAAKLYLLWRDTDLDFIYFGGSDRSNSYGFDFSKNLAENFEVHGEVGLKLDQTRSVLDSQGGATLSREDQWSYLVGARWLNSVETTVIAEYYHNGAGYDSGQLDAFFAYQERAYRNWLSSGNASYMERAERSTRPYYRQRTFGRDYLYLKISQKEPFGVLYFTPWLAVIVNLQDQSLNLQPGMTYTPLTNLELNFRVGIPLGPAGSEFGEKQDLVRPEMWVRYFF